MKKLPFVKDGIRGDGILPGAVATTDLLNFNGVYTVLRAARRRLRPAVDLVQLEPADLRVLVVGEPDVAVRADRKT